MRSAGIAGYRINVRVRLTSGRTVVFDFLFEDIGLVLETDGHRYHGTVTAARRDRQRDLEAAADGYLVKRIPFALHADRDATLSLVRDAIAEARARNRPPGFAHQ